MIKNQQINIFKNLKIHNQENYKSNLLKCIHQLIKFVELEDGYIFLDVGTNVSEVTDELLKNEKKGEIHCFEPHSVLFKNLEIKHKNNENVILNKVAVSNNNGTAQFYYKKDPTKYDDDDGSSLRSDKSNISGEYKEVVKTIKLSDYISKFASVDVLKMDIEGSEYDVLEELITSGAIHKIKYIFYECHEHKVPNIKKKKIDVLTKLTKLGIKTYYW
jgi:FkbM family methyltransferase